MNKARESTAIEALSANVLDTRFEDLDKVTIENAKNRIIDVVGCIIGGTNAAGNSAIVNLIKKWGGEKEATILGHGGKVPAHHAAMLNAIMARSFDYEVMMVLVEDKMIPSHYSATTVPTALTLGEAKEINGKELITALVVGDDVAARVLAASGSNMGLGWDGTGTLSHLGATAIAGRLLGLTRLQMRYAFGIMLNQVAGASQGIWDGATTFKLGQGAAARNAIFSAELAKLGWTGVEDALLSRFGYFNLFTRGCKNPEMLTGDLGKKFYAEANFKPYPCCLATHRPIEAALSLVAGYPITAENIEKVTVGVPRGSLDDFCAKPFRPGDFFHCQSIYSFQYTVATALLRGSVKQEHFTEKAVRDPRITALIAKTTLEELPGPGGNRFEVKVKIANGKEYAESRDTARGNPISQPLSQAEIIAKYRAQVEFSKTVSRSNSEKLLALFARLEEVDNVNKIPELAVIQN